MQTNIIITLILKPCSFHLTIASKQTAFQILFSPSSSISFQPIFSVVSPNQKSEVFQSFKQIACWYILAIWSSAKSKLSIWNYLLICLTYWLLFCFRDQVFARLRWSIISFTVIISFWLISIKILYGGCCILGIIRLCHERNGWNFSRFFWIVLLIGGSYSHIEFDNLWYFIDIIWILHCNWP